MLRTLGLGTILAASCAAGALALAPTQAFVFAHFTSAAIDAQTHAQGIAIAMLAFGATLVGFVLSGVPPFVEASRIPAQKTDAKSITVALKVEVDDSALDRTRAKAEGLRAVVESIAPHVSLLSDAPPTQGRTVTLIRGDKGRFRSANPDARPRRRRSDRMAVAEGE